MILDAHHVACAVSREYVKYGNLVHHVQCCAVEKTLEQEDDDWYTDKRWTWRLRGDRFRFQDKPAIVSNRGDKEWYVGDVLDRPNDLPAVVWKNGHREWWVRGRLHRGGDKAAILSADSKYQQWWFDGQLHRSGGLPAVIYDNGGFVMEKWEYNKLVYIGTPESARWQFPKWSLKNTPGQRLRFIRDYDGDNDW